MSVDSLARGIWRRFVRGSLPSGFYWGPDSNITAASVQGQQIVKDDTHPFAGNPAVAPFELQHNGTQGYIFHLTQGASMSGSAALIGMGVDAGGVGLFVNNKVSGIGIKITQNSTITDSGAYGMLVNGGKGAAPAVFMQQNNDDGSLNAQPCLRLHAYRSFSASQKLFDWYKPDGSTSGTLAGWIRAEDGAFIVQDAPLIVSGGDVAFQASGATGGNLTCVTATASGAGAYIGIYNTNGTADKRRFRFTISSRFLTLGGRDDAGTSTGDLMIFENTARNVGFAGQNSFGGGAKVVAIPDATTVPTTNPSGGGILYCEGGALKFRGSSGTVTTLGVA